MLARYIPLRQISPQRARSFDNRRDYSNRQSNWHYEELNLQQYKEKIL